MNQTTRLPFDQRLARAAVRPLVNTPVTPNMITLLGLVVGLAAGVLYARGDAASANWGAGLFLVAAWLDHADGEHARATGQTSTFGHYFDHAGAMTSYIALFVGAGIGLRQLSGGALGAPDRLGDWAVPLGIAAGLSVAAIFSVRMALEIRDGRQSVKQTVYAGFEVEDALYIAAPVTWLGFLEPFLVAAGIGAPLFLVYVIWEATRKKPAREQSPRGGPHDRSPRNGEGA